MKYLLILGTQRSGKTLIARALNMHPNIIAHMEPFFFFFKICRNVFYRDIIKKTDFDPDYPMDSNFCKPLKEKKIFRESFSRILFKGDDIRRLKELTVKQQNALPGERAEKIIPLLDKLEIGTAPAVFKQLMTLLYEAYHKNDVQIIGVSEGWCDDFIEPFLDLSDLEVKCIHCLRDPRAIVASRNKGTKILEEYGGKKYPLLFIIRHWRKTIAYSIVNSGYPKYYAVRYEELIQDPKRSFKKICNFLGIAFSEKLLFPSTFIRGDGSLWRQNSSFNIQNQGEFNTSSIERWKKALSLDVIGVIEYLCKAEMSYLQLERYNPEFSLRDILLFKEKEEEIVEWLKKYNWSISEKELMPEIARNLLIERHEIANMDNIKDYFCIDTKAFDVFSSLGSNKLNNR